MKKLTTTPDYWIADTATVVGNVTLGKNVSIWYGAVLRGDMGDLTVGDNTNIQDNAVLHEGTTIGKGCTVGHSAIVHACTVGDNTLIGMGSIVLDGAVIGNNCIVGAGALVTGRTVVPDNSMILGSPAKIIKPMTEEAIERNRRQAIHYMDVVARYREEEE
ncbi:MAG: gamma carbonic anhydrase family protein [Oscillospiraceae bacterium]|nr:gamma carbonic anhydrase family protein [Oscillospiraceae bacterium]